MGFDDIPEDRYESYPCEVCEGDIVLEEGLWACNRCDFKPSNGVSMDSKTFKKEVHDFVDIYCSKMSPKIEFEEEDLRAVITIKDLCLQEWEVPICVNPNRPNIAIECDDYVCMEADGEGLYWYLWIEATCRLMSRENDKA